MNKRKVLADLEWVLRDSGLIDVQAKKGNHQKAIDKDLKFAGYNLWVTSELEMDDIDIYMQAELL